MQMPVSFAEVWVDEDYNIVRGEVIALSESLDEFRDRWEKEEEEVGGANEIVAALSASEHGEEQEADQAPASAALEGASPDAEEPQTGVSEEVSTEETEASTTDDEALQEEANEATVGGEVMGSEPQEDLAQKTPEGDNGGSNANTVEPSINIQQELIKEVLEHFKQEINIHLENKDKGPLDEALLRRLMAFPDCLPDDEGELEQVLERIETYLENPEALLYLIQENDVDKARIEELTAKLLGKQPPYAADLSEIEWNQLLAMVCAYLSKEGEQVRYALPLTVYLDDDYYLIDPNKTEFSNGDTIIVESYMAGTTLLMKDAEGQPIELSSSHFPDNVGQIWPPGFTVDIEELGEGETEEIKILIPEVDTLKIIVAKLPLPSDVPIFDIDEADIEAVADNCVEWVQEDSVNRSYTCNFCVRDAFYKITGLTLLYPGSPNNACICCNPEEYNIVGGLVNGNGTANTIYSTLIDANSDLAQYFEEILDIEGEDYPDFTQMQLNANNGQLIIGVKNAGTGHVVLLMPEGLWEEDNDNDVATLVEYSDETKRSRPIALECGQAVNKRVQPVRWSLNSLKGVKWYRYKGL